MTVMTVMIVKIIMIIIIIMRMSNSCQYFISLVGGKTVMEQYLRTYAEVDLEAIAHNIAEVRKKVGKDVMIAAVIKADGYGHGSVPVAKRLEKDVDFFCVAAIEEAVELREHGFDLPILILGYTSPSQYEDIVKYHIAQTIYDYDTAKQLNKTAKKMGEKAIVHIALDTGMNRIGFYWNEQSIDDIEAISKMEHIDLEGCFSHFSCADMTDKTFSKMQMQVYDDFMATFDKRGITIPIKHLSNSAGIMEFDSHRFNMVRSGIITYGLYPSDEVDKTALQLRPALQWKTHVIHVKTVGAGAAVSYGATYVTDRQTKIATISIGYADGYPRALSNKGRVLIHGQSAPIIGRVCMDQIMVDVTHIPDVKVEDVVTLVGPDGDEYISVEEAAELSGSFNYEFICDISKRVPRIYY